MQSTRNDLISIDEAIRLYGTSYQTIRRRIAGGELTVYLDGGDRRKKLIPVSQLNRVFAIRPIVDNPAEAA